MYGTLLWRKTNHDKHTELQAAPPNKHCDRHIDGLMPHNQPPSMPRYNYATTPTVVMTMPQQSSLHALTVATNSLEPLSRLCQPPHTACPMAQCTHIKCIVYLSDIQLLAVIRIHPHTCHANITRASLTACVPLEQCSLILMLHLTRAALDLGSQCACPYQMQPS